MQRAKARRDVAGLFALMTDNPTNFEWIKSRIEHMWPQWTSAYDQLSEKHKEKLAQRQRRKILLHLGFLTKETNLKMGEKANAGGGPLGELVQWSDLIAAVFLLGAGIVHIYEIAATGNMAFGNAGPILWSDLYLPIAAIVLLVLAAVEARRAATPSDVEARAAA